MKYEIHLAQDTGFFGTFANERPDKVIEVYARNKRVAAHMCLNALLEAPKKYERAFVFDNENNMIIHIERTGY